MRDPLEYTEEELNNLSTGELESLVITAQELEVLYNTEQLVLKLLINSLYGALANRWFPLFNEDIAAAITGNGRYFIRKLADYVEETLQNMHPMNTTYVVYGDTDSIYFHIEPFMDMYQAKNPGLTIGEYVDWADSFEKKVIAPVIQQCVKDFAHELNAYNAEVIGVEREIIADCIAPRTPIRVKSDGVTSTITISKLAAMSGIETLTHTPNIKDISHKNIEILSQSPDGVKELKRILNIQKKITTKDYIELTAPSGKTTKVTEDHLIGVTINGKIEYKQAQFITEDDDVVIYNNTIYTKSNCELYGVKYINFRSANSDSIKKRATIDYDKVDTKLFGDFL